MKHIHKLVATWVLATGIAAYDGFYRIVFWARCRDCGLEGTFAAEQSAADTEGRLLEPGE